jgi:hypothetical protein
MRSDFSTRLQRTRHAANLTVAELARWFDRPDPTVRAWVSGAASPGGPPLDIAHAQAMLGLLESLVRKGKLPAPKLGREERAAWLARLREACVG